MTDTKKSPTMDSALSPDNMLDSHSTKTSEMASKRKEENQAMDSALSPDNKLDSHSTKASALESVPVAIPVTTMESLPLDCFAMKSIPALSPDTKLDSASTKTSVPYGHLSSTDDGEGDGSNGGNGHHECGLEAGAERDIIPICLRGLRGSQAFVKVGELERAAVQNFHSFIGAMSHAWAQHTRLPPPPAVNVDHLWPGFQIHYVAIDVHFALHIVPLEEAGFANFINSLDLIIVEAE